MFLLHALDSNTVNHINRESKVYHIIGYDGTIDMTNEEH